METETKITGSGRRHVRSPSFSFGSHHESTCALRCTVSETPHVPSFTTSLVGSCRGDFGTRKDLKVHRVTGKCRDLHVSVHTSVVVPPRSPTVLGSLVASVGRHPPCKLYNDIGNPPVLSLCPRLCSYLPRQPSPPTSEYGNFSLKPCHFLLRCTGKWGRGR